MCSGTQWVKKRRGKVGEVYFKSRCSSFLQQQPRQQRAKHPPHAATTKNQARHDHVTCINPSFLCSLNPSNQTLLTHTPFCFPTPTTSNSIMLPADDSAAPASTTPPSSPPPPQSCFSKLNDFLHRDYVTDVAFYGFWLGFWLLMPTTIFLGTLALAAYDLVTMKGYRQPCGPVLVTGCDMGFGKDLALALAAKGWKVRMVVGVGQGGWDSVRGLVYFSPVWVRCLCALPTFSTYKHLPFLLLFR